MNNQKLIALLAKHAKGFTVTNETQEHKKGETVTTRKKQFIPGDIRAVQLLLQLNKSEKENSGQECEKSLPIDDLIDELRTAVVEAEKMINEYDNMIHDYGD